MSEELTGSAVREIRLGRAAWGKKGYRIEEVDDFLARAAEALDARRGGRRVQLTADDVHTVVFRKPGFRQGRGYDEDEVDALLDRVEAALR